MVLLQEFPDQLMLGMDAARPSYWRNYGGSPGLTYLLDVFSDAMERRGVGRDSWHRIFISTPAAAYAFAARD